MEPLYKGHIETLETVLYIEVVLNSEANHFFFHGGYSQVSLSDYFCSIF